MTKRREIAYPVKSEGEIQFALRWAESMIRKGLAAGEVVMYLGRARRNKDQNALLWAVLTDVSKQVDWYGQRLTKEEWKDVFTAALKQQKAVPGIDGGFVVLGASTSRMRKRELSDLVELIHAFGAEREVVWSKPAKDVMRQQGVAA